jgi:hypothetical protein
MPKSGSSAFFSYKCHLRCIPSCERAQESLFYGYFMKSGYDASIIYYLKIDSRGACDP